MTTLITREELNINPTVAIPAAWDQFYGLDDQIIGAISGMPMIVKINKTRQSGRDEVGEAYTEKLVSIEIRDGFTVEDLKKSIERILKFDFPDLFAAPAPIVEPTPVLYYLDIRSRTFPNGFSSIESAVIVETTETAPLDCFRRPEKIDDITGYYFTRRDLAEIALKYHLDRNSDEAGIYGPKSQIAASNAAGGRLASHRADFEKKLSALGQS